MAAAVGALAVPAAASAYAPPPSPSCAFRPLDPPYSTGQPIWSGSVSVPANGQAVIGPTPGFSWDGNYMVAVSDNDGPVVTFSAWVKEKDTSAAFDNVAWNNEAVTTATPGVSMNVFDGGGAALEIVVRNTGAAAHTFTAFVTPEGISQDGLNTQQSLSDDCSIESTWWATQHDDVQAVKSAVTALAPGGTTLGDIKSSVDALTTGATLNTLDGDLAQLHSDNLAIEAELNGGAPSGGGTATDVSLTGPVQLSPADRQLEADVAGQTDGDLWIIVGAIVGCFAFGFVVNRVWPA
jgi:hypothetical protein